MPLHHRGWGGAEELALNRFVVAFGPAVARARVLVHEVLNRGAQAAARGAARCASHVLDRDAQADARGAAQVLDRGAGPKPTAPRRYLVVLPNPMPAAPFVVRRRYLIAAPGRCPRRRSLCVAGT
jgi:hypothetical protein